MKSSSLGQEGHADFAECAFDKLNSRGGANPCALCIGSSALVRSRLDGVAYTRPWGEDQEVERRI